MPANIKSQIAASKCYGLLYDSEDVSCKRCEVWFTCERTMQDRTRQNTETGKVRKTVQLKFPIDMLLGGC